MNLRSMELFVLVCDAKSFSAVARSEGVAQSVVSRHVARLEDELGTKLLHRSTRAVEPTDSGRAFLRRARSVIRLLAEAQTEMSDSVEHPRGPIRVTAPMTLGRRYVAPAIVAFLQQHPDVQIDLLLRDASVSFATERVDVALRLGNIDDATLKGRRIGASRLAVVATPAFLEGAPPIRTLADLSGMEGVFLRSGGRLFRGWSTTVGDGFSGARARLIVDDLESARAAVLAGLGPCVLPQWLIGDDLHEGRLVAICAEAPLKPMPVWLLHVDPVPPRVRRLLDHLADSLEIPL